MNSNYKLFNYQEAGGFKFLQASPNRNPQTTLILEVLNSGFMQGLNLNNKI